MNPLSAINAFVQPNGLITLLPKINQAPNIPAAELQTLAPATSTQPTSDILPAAAPSFDNLLGKMVGEVNAKQIAANNAVTGMLSGQQVSLHQAMIATEEANVSFQMMVEVRNRLLDSYQELMRMQI